MTCQLSIISFCVRFFPLLEFMFFVSNTPVYIFFLDHEIARTARVCGYDVCSIVVFFYFALHVLEYVIVFHNYIHCLNFSASQVFITFVLCCSLSNYKNFGFLEKCRISPSFFSLKIPYKSLKNTMACLRNGIIN